MERKLYRSDRNRMLCGVCGGLGEFRGIDPTIIRLLWAIWCMTGIGLIVYLVACLIIPQEN